MLTINQPRDRAIEPAGDRQTRVLFFGMSGVFSLVTLEALLAAGVGLCGVVVAADRLISTAPPIEGLLPDHARSALPLINPFVTRTIVHVAWERDVPAFQVGRLDDPATLATLADLRPDVACVACFPQIVPTALLALPPHGFLNVHPALLPAHRGPAPLFWTFRNGERSTGVTIHFMDAGLDTGDIAAQAPLELANGISGSEADRLCARLGGKLLIDTLRALAQGRLIGRSQPEGGSYEPWPTSADFRLSANWPARRAFNFMRGTAEWEQPYDLMINRERLALRTALSYTPDGLLPAPTIQQGRTIRIQFTPGVLDATTD